MFQNLWWISYKFLRKQSLQVCMSDNIHLRSYIISNWWIVPFLLCCREKWYWNRSKIFKPSYRAKPCKYYFFVCSQYKQLIHQRTTGVKACWCGYWQFFSTTPPIDIFPTASLLWTVFQYSQRLAANWSGQCSKKNPK